jgi:hypothetical protein
MTIHEHDHGTTLAVVTQPADNVRPVRAGEIAHARKVA